MVGCCKFGPCRKKRTYEFNNPPYSAANKESGVYHSSKQKLADDGPVKNGSANNPAFESGSADSVPFKGAAVVDLDSECNSIAEEVRRNSKHKKNKDGFKNADLVVVSKSKDIKDSKRSSKSSSSSSSSSSESSKGSKRSSRHSDVAVVVVVADNNTEQHSDHEETIDTANIAEVDANEIEATVVTTSEGEELVEDIEGGAIAYQDEDASSENIVVVKTEHITETIVGREVTEEEVSVQDEEPSSARRGSQSSSSSSSSRSSDAKSYQVDEAEQNNKEDFPEEKEQASGSDEYSYEVVEAPPGIEELDNEANEMVQEFSDESYSVNVIEEVSVNAHGDDEEHEEHEEHDELGSEDL